MTWETSCHKHINHGLGQSTDDEATNAELEVKRLGTLEVVSHETLNLGSLGLTREHGEIYGDQGDNMT